MKIRHAWFFLALLSVGCEASPPTPVVEVPKPSSAAPSNVSQASPSEAGYLLDLADVHLRHGHLDEALSLYLKISALTLETTQAGRAAYGCALVHILKGDRKIAVGYLRAALEYAPSKRKPELRLQLARLYREIKDVAQADKEYDGILVGHSDEAVTNAAAQETMDLAVEAGMVDTLRSRWEGRVTGTPPGTFALAFLASLYGTVGKDSDKAISTYQKLRELEPDKLVYVQNLLNLYQVGKRYDDCVKVCQEERKKAADPKDQAQWFRYEAEFLIKKEDAAGAVNVLEEALKLQLPEAQTVPLRLARWLAMKEAGKLEEEIAKLEKDGARPAKVDLLTIYSDVLQNQVTALKIVEDLLKELPDNAWLLEQAGMRYLALNKPKSAAETYDRLLKADAKQAPRVMEPYVKALVATQSFESAVTFLNDLRKTDPSLGLSVLRWLFVVETARKNETEAQERARELIDAASRSEDPQEVLVVALLLRQAGRSREALTVLEPFATRSPDNKPAVEIRFTLIDLCLDLREFARAEHDCKALIAAATTLEVRHAAERKLLEVRQRQGKGLDPK